MLFFPSFTHAQVRDIETPMAENPSLPTVVTKAYDVLLWCVNHVGKFPRSHRFVLGERIETAMLDTVLLLVTFSPLSVFCRGVPVGRLSLMALRRGTKTTCHRHVATITESIGLLS